MNTRNLFRHRSRTLRLLIMPVLLCAALVTATDAPATAAVSRAGAYFSAAAVWCDPGVSTLEVTTNAYTEAGYATQYVEAQVAIYRNGALAHHYFTKPWLAGGTHLVGNQLTVSTWLGMNHGRWQVSIRYRWWRGSYWTAWSGWQTTQSYYFRDFSAYAPISYGYCYM